jgi:ATP-dependent helicase HrpA
MKALKLGDISEFPFIDPPDTRAVRDGYQTLHEIGAIDERNELTEIGWLLSKLPIDPRIGRVVLAARDENVLSDILIIAAALSVQDPRERPMDKQQDADAAHAQFRDPNSDFLSFLKLWDAFHEHKKHLSGSKLRKWCKDNFLSFVRMREWDDIHAQLKEIISEPGMKARDEGRRMKDGGTPLPVHGQRAGSRGLDPLRSDAIHRALLVGLLSNIGVKSESFEYNGARNTKFHLFPGSALFSRKPPWVMAAELVETTKLYARTVAPIRPEWVERLAGHLLKKSYADPHWQPHTGHVMAYERVTLFGLTLVPRRSVHYGPIDPKTSRQLFIQHALVDADWYTNGAFFRHNQDLIDRIQTIENKSRRRDLLADPQAQFDFYDKRIPAGVYNGPLFEKWRRQAEAQTPKLLFMTEQDLMKYDAPPLAWEQFPDDMTVNGMVLPLQYRLEPGHPEDGLTVTIPFAALNQLSPEPFEWLVPGLLKEKILALIRSLPKALRTNFVPAPDVADAAFPALRTRTGSLLDALADWLGKRSGIKVTRHDFQLDTLPDHLRMNFRIIDPAGKEVASGRDLLELRRKVGGEAQSTFSAGAEAEFNRDGITRWDFGDLPEKVEVSRHGMRLVGYPALVDAGTSVSLRVRETPESAAATSRAGLRRLFLLQLSNEFRSLSRRLPIDESCLHYAPIGDCDQLRADIVTAAADRALYADPSPVYTRQQFIDRAADAWKRLPEIADSLVEIAQSVLESFHQLNLALERPYPPLLQPSIQDIQSHLRTLVHKGFMLNTPPEALEHLPRYLKAIEIRLKKLTNAGLSRDVTNRETIAPLWDAFVQRLAEHEKRGVVDPQLQAYRWMLEELRVSLFAQELKTAIPISVQRLQRQWDSCRSK